MLLSFVIPAKPGGPLLRAEMIGVGALSGLINLLMLTGSIFMLQVYDRVLPSRSMPTLATLGLLALVMYVFTGFFEVLRARILVRCGASIAGTLGNTVFQAVVRLPLRTGLRREGIFPLTDLDTVRGFVSGPGFAILFDIVWVPFYLAICFMFHWVLGIAVLLSAGLLFAVTLLAERCTSGAMRKTTAALVRRNGIVDTTRRNAEAAIAMGMASAMGRRWSEANRAHLWAALDVSDASALFSGFSRTFRMALQSALLGLGAWLVLRGEATGGVIIASSIIGGKALAPIDGAIAHWRPFIAARQARDRLMHLLQNGDRAEAMDLPGPQEDVAVEGVTIVPPGTQRPVVHGLSFVLKAGQALAIIGPSASGKSSVARTLVGAWAPAFGHVRIDGAPLDQWPETMRSRNIGYLPQDVELFTGTVAENIGRFTDAVDAEAVVAAAKQAGIHDMILRFPEGYQTQIGENGAVLSAGQRQRIALARALYGTPFLVVLDEPNANLDTDGEVALAGAVKATTGRGGIVVVVSHRTSVLAAVDSVLAMSDGRNVAFGPRDDVMKRLVRRDPAGPGPFQVVGERK